MSNRGGTKERLDNVLVDRGLFSSREKAKRAVLAGIVKVNGEIVNKAAVRVPVDVEIEVKEKPAYVSRGGEKLAGALKDFNLVVKDLTAVDIGASTGGFTDCLLQHGVKRIFAVDVGYGQLDWSLRNDQRVEVIERKNARYLTADDIGTTVELVTIDVSFISLTKILPASSSLLKDGGIILALIKPQFEAGPEEVGKGGVVREESVRKDVIENIKHCASNIGLEVKKVTQSCLKGPAGNVEYFIYLKKNT